MPRKIGFANKKGGVGKTTSVVNIASFLALKSYQVLVIDLDLQGNTSFILGVAPYMNKSGISSILLEDNPSLEKTVAKTCVPNLFLLPADNRLNEVDLILRKDNKGVSLLAEKISEMEKKFDFIILDFPPSLSLLTLNGFFYLKEIVIPVQTNYLSMDGVLQMTRLVYKINSKLNPDLKITAVLPTMCDLRTNMHFEVMNELESVFGAEKILPLIHSDVKLAEIAKFKKPIMFFSPHSQGSIDYLNATKRLINSRP